MAAECPHGEDIPALTSGPLCPPMTCATFRDNLKLAERQPAFYDSPGLTSDLIRFRRSKCDTGLILRALLGATTLLCVSLPVSAQQESPKVTGKRKVISFGVRPDGGKMLHHRDPDGRRHLEFFDVGGTRRFERHLESGGIIYTSPRGKYASVADSRHSSDGSTTEIEVLSASGQSLWRKSLQGTPGVTISDAGTLLDLTNRVLYDRAGVPRNLDISYSRLNRVAWSNSGETLLLVSPDRATALCERGIRCQTSPYGPYLDGEGLKPGS